MCDILEAETARAATRGERLRGVLHAFSEGADVYCRLKKCGDWLFGIGGVVTFKKSIVAEAVAEMELEDIIIETDCPYLTPVPYRGKRNESAYVAYVCEKVAEIKGVSAAEVGRVTTANARRMFLPKE
jgi:TatD DNase family protein